MHESQPEKYETSAAESPQWLVRVYRDSHGITRTVSQREHPGDTYGPEHLLLATNASDL